MARLTSVANNLNPSDPAERKELMYLIAHRAVYDEVKAYLTNKDYLEPNRTAWSPDEVALLASVRAENLDALRKSAVEQMARHGIVRRNAARSFAEGKLSYGLLKEFVCPEYDWDEYEF